jgi:hypothetical protein
MSTSQPRRVDPILQEGSIGSRRRAELVAHCDELEDQLRQLDRQMDHLSQQRQSIADDLRRHRRRLFIRLTPNGRQPSTDGRMQLPPVPHGAVQLWGRRLRRLCLALLHRLGPLSLVELHAQIHRHRFAVGSLTPVKALADALGYETDAGRAQRVRRGTYRTLVAPANRPMWPGGPRPDELTTYF